MSVAQLVACHHTDCNSRILYSLGVGKYFPLAGVFRNILGKFPAVTKTLNTVLTLLNLLNILYKCKNI